MNRNNTFLYAFYFVARVDSSTNITRKFVITAATSHKFGMTLSCSQSPAYTIYMFLTPTFTLIAVENYTKQACDTSLYKFGYSFNLLLQTTIFFC